VWTNLLSEPLFTLYGGFLAVILYRDMGASVFQIALLAMLKPVSTILSFYWSAGEKNLKRNVLWAGFWMRAPFLLCPWIDEAWYVIAAAVNYMFFYRAGIPSWLEIVKRNLKEGRDRAFSWSSALGYGEGVVLSLAMGTLLDRDPGMWKVLFCGAAVVGLLSLVVISRIKVEGEVPVRERVGLKELLVWPWRDSWALMRDRPDFSRFQWGFMISGFGLMLFQPVVPLFIVNWLNVSYLELAVGMSIAKGLGFVASSPMWGRWMERSNIIRVSSGVFFAFGLFPFVLGCSVWGIGWFYLAYFLYGIGQGGSHLVWNMSGPIFAGKEESSRYSGVNVAMAGLRGAIAPGLGGWMSVLVGPVQVLLMGGILCFYGGMFMLRRRVEEKVGG
jgi:MFS family permease